MWVGMSRTWRGGSRGPWTKAVGTVNEGKPRLRWTSGLLALEPWGGGRVRSGPGAIASRQPPVHVDWGDRGLQCPGERRAGRGQGGGRAHRGKKGPRGSAVIHPAPFLPPGHHHVDVARTRSVSETQHALVRRGPLLWPACVLVASTNVGTRTQAPLLFDSSYVLPPVQTGRTSLAWLPLPRSRT